MKNALKRKTLAIVLCLFGLITMLTVPTTVLAADGEMLSARK